MSPSKITNSITGVVKRAYELLFSRSLAAVLLSVAGTNLSATRSPNAGIPL